MPAPPQLPQTISPPPIQTPSGEKTASGFSWPWIKWFQEVARVLGILIMLETKEPAGPFADDAAAAAAGVAIGGMYYQPNGTVMVRQV